MRIGMILRRRPPISFRNYRDNMLRELTALSTEIVAFYEDEQTPASIDILWAPEVGLELPPPVQHTRLPIVCTVHGGRIFYLPYREQVTSLVGAWRLHKVRKRIRSEWRMHSNAISAVIVPSAFSAKLFIDVFAWPPETVHAIHHGVDCHKFFPIATPDSACRIRPYFLHVSQHRDGKNIARILAAYRRLPALARPDLVLKVTGHPGPVPRQPGVVLLREETPIAQLADLYRGAVALVFPSLYESFGMPILEAMACGVPVITSNSTGCREVAGGACEIVNAHSVGEIAAAMSRVAVDHTWRSELIRKGLTRARSVPWIESASRHLNVFRCVAAGKSISTGSATPQNGDLLNKCAGLKPDSSGPYRS